MHIYIYIIYIYTIYHTYLYLQRFMCRYEHLYALPNHPKVDHFSIETHGFWDPPFTFFFHIHLRYDMNSKHEDVTIYSSDKR